MQLLQGQLPWLVLPLLVLLLQLMLLLLHGRN
jgi:hypothetical protein